MASDASSLTSKTKRTYFPAARKEHPVTVSYKTFNRLFIILGILAVALLPFWPYSRWGYFPSGLAIAGVIFLFAIKALART
jgi:hypothetical protein